MAQYGKATERDRSDLLDFANFVFSQAHRPHDFKTLLPKVYGDGVSDAEMASSHYLAKQDGRIRALVCCPVITMDVAGAPLTIGTVGTVSVHPYARGEGHMRALMHMMIDDMRARGVDLLVLGGQRQRYGYYGFDGAGTRVDFAVTRTNMRHCFGGANPNGLRFDELTAADARVRTAHALYERQPLRGARPSNRFHTIACSWDARLYAAMRDDDMLGYVIASRKDDIGEIYLERESDLPCVLGAWMALMDADKVELGVMPHETERMRALAAFAEWYEVHTEDMILPLRWENCLRAGLAQKALYTPLEDGALTFLLDGQGVSVAVRGGEALVSAAPADAGADVVLNGTEAIRALYSPITPFLRAGRAHPSWTPLPFSMPSPDRF